jgi:NADH-quinone oxidoreductase subunit C
VYEPVHLNQEYRDFDFLSPWEGMQLPQVGDDSDTEEEQAGA